MSYYTNIPLSTDKPSNSQPQINTNFTTLSSVFAVDHVTYAANPSSGVPGNHQFVNINAPSADPSLTNPTSRIYTKSFGSSATYVEPYFAQPNSNMTQLNTLIPTIKAIATFQLTGSAGTQTVITTNTLNFNIGTTSVQAAGAGNTTITVTFTVPLQYNTYYINFLNTNLGAIIPTTIMTTSFQITINNNAGQPPIRFYVF